MAIFGIQIGVWAFISVWASNRVFKVIIFWTYVPSQTEQTLIVCPLQSRPSFIQLVLPFKSLSGAARFSFNKYVK